MTTYLRESTCVAGANAVVRTNGSRPRSTLWSCYSLLPPVQTGSLYLYPSGYGGDIRNDEVVCSGRDGITQNKAVPVTGRFQRCLVFFLCAQYLIWLLISSSVITYIKERDDSTVTRVNRSNMFQIDLFLAWAQISSSGCLLNMETRLHSLILKVR